MKMKMKMKHKPFARLRILLRALYLSVALYLNRGKAIKPGTDD